MTSIFRITLVSAALACLIAPPIISAKDAPPLPKGKETTLGLYLTASEAYDKWKASPDKVKVLDVRTPEEFLFIGHAPMAWNVPLATQTFKWDTAQKQFPMQPLPDFLDRARKVAGPQDTLLVMCRSGGRSARAVNLLASAGYKNVYNITDGFEGDTVRDPGSVFDGQHMVNGWRNSGLPWTYEVDPAHMVLPPGR
jgi:rhodanese-related sulfurtransferase